MMYVEAVNEVGASRKSSDAERRNVACEANTVNEANTADETNHLNQSH